MRNFHNFRDFLPLASVHQDRSAVVVLSVYIGSLVGQGVFTTFEIASPWQRP